MASAMKAKRVQIRVDTHVVRVSRKAHEMLMWISKMRGRQSGVKRVPLNWIVERLVRREVGEMARGTPDVLKDATDPTKSVEEAG